MTEVQNLFISAHVKSRKFHEFEKKMCVSSMKS